ncbi:MAG: hypothetical protein WAL25_12905, partial [Acidimicrobiia bacterium]
MAENHANQTIDFDDPANGVGPVPTAPGGPVSEETGVPADGARAAGTVTTNGPALQRAQRLRSRLHDAMVELERTAAQPTDSDRWLAGV